MSVYHIVRIVLGAFSGKDCSAGEELGKLIIEGWAGDQLPLPACHSHLTDKNIWTATSEQLLFRGEVPLPISEFPSVDAQVITMPCAGRNEGKRIFANRRCKSKGEPLVLTVRAFTPHFLFAKGASRFMISATRAFLQL